MILNMGPLLRGEITRMEIEYDLAPETVHDVTFPEDAHIKGYITDDAGYMRLFLHATLSYRGQCARCLDEVSGVFELDFVRTVAAEGSITEEQLAEMDDAYVMIRDGKLDVDVPLKEELLMCFPMRLLCREDCRGLCDRCGKRLGEGECGCAKKEIDPRLAILKKWSENQENN